MPPHFVNFSPETAENGWWILGGLASSVRAYRLTLRVLQLAGTTEQAL